MEVIPTANDSSTYEDLGYSLDEWLFLWAREHNHKNDIEFWQSLTPNERLFQLEFLRRVQMGKVALGLMQKTVKFVKAPWIKNQK